MGDAILESFLHTAVKFGFDYGARGGLSDLHNLSESLVEPLKIILAAAGYFTMVDADGSKISTDMLRPRAPLTEVKQ